MTISYFIADKQPSDIDLAFLNSIGLDYAFESSPSIGQVINNGPNGGAGVVVACDALAAKVLDQSWEPHDQVEGCWIGYPKDIAIESLKRESWQDVPSYTCKDWTVPIARSWLTASETSSVLPRGLNFTDGKFCPGPVVDRYKRLEEIGSQIVEVILSGQMPDNGFELAFEVANMVYRVGPQEFAKIGPVEYSHQSAYSFLCLVADQPGWLELTDDQKKTTTE